ncbi:MAG: NTP transferase domain-containing protein [Acidobacteria bacterium]|nr:NTP transferase domain-containing protein [Acidobacteriota bacterium]MDW7983063.1 NTP transferase domain-containing protein [Acidobacteriota bacterium]
MADSVPPGARGRWAHTDRGLGVFVLAGGQSRRLGVDKRFLEIDGQPLLRAIFDRWRDWHPVLLGGPVPTWVWPGPQWLDPAAGLGPARALAMALRRWGRDAWFLSADVPWLPSDVLGHVARRCGGSACGWDAHVFRVGQWFIPVGWVHPTALQPRPSASFQQWWQVVRCEVLDPSAFSSDDVPWWQDLDTPADLRFWRRYWLRRGHILQAL